MKCFERARHLGFQIPEMSEIEFFQNTKTKVLSGKAVAAEIRAQCKSLAVGRAVPKLAVVLVGDDPASHVYVKNKETAFAQVGFQSSTHRLAHVTQAELEELIASLACDPKVHGILVQMPLPKGLDPQRALARIPASKDVDGYHAHNLGLLCAQDWSGFLPCTPIGVMVLLGAYGIKTSGKLACIVGRSNTVGKPQGLLLLGEDATVTFAHSRTTPLSEVTKQADILVVAAGQPRLLGKEHVKEGAVVVDVGIHQKPEGGGLCGDTRSEELLGWASALSPVPGGVGPITIAMLLLNTALGAWEAR